MDVNGQRILECLQGVEVERRRRLTDVSLARRVAEVKRFQHERFTRTYEDLLSSPGYGAAARFFLTELYGPYDFSARDQQFERIVPALVRLFPLEIVKTVRALGELHLLSEQLDTRMAEVLQQAPVDAAAYGRAWRAVAEPELRERQIELTLAVGSALERYTRRPLLRGALRAMRRPARMAGLGSLQQFLESGFDTFREMPNPQEFLRLVGIRERDVARDLFNASDPLK